MAHVSLVPAEPWHVGAIAANAREADVAELWASFRRTPASAMEFGLRHSADPRVGLVDGEPVCMFGVTPGTALGGVSVPWMIGARRLEQHQFAFLRRCRPVVREWLARYHRLENYVDARNVRAINWLGWLGFTIHEPEPRGVDGLPFLRFDMRD